MQTNDALMVNKKRFHKQDTHFILNYEMRQTVSTGCQKTQRGVKEYLPEKTFKFL